jgi:SulP family sulfate permease
VGLVQGAAISQTVPNPDGKFPDVSGDFRGQGIANIASGFLQGAPVGGSMSATGLVIAGGGRSRLVNLSAGAVMIVVILLLGNLAGFIAMPALAALLMLVGYRTLKPEKIFMVWKTGATQATVMSVTFVLTILIPLQYAVLAGIAISIVLFVARQSNKIVVKRWVFSEGSILPREETPPVELLAGDTVVLAPYGSLFFAAAPIFESQLPQVTTNSRGAVVILRLRGKEELGSTFIQVITRYATLLQAQDSHLLLCGVDSRVYSQLSQTTAVRTLGKKNIFIATSVVGESLTTALSYARQLLTPTEPPTKEKS